MLFVLYRDTLGQLGRGMKTIRDNRQKRVATDLRSNAGKPHLEIAKPTIIVKDDKRPGTKTKEDQGPVFAPAETRVGDLVVNVSSAMLAKISRDNPNQCLLLKIKVRNESKKPINFWSWSQQDNRVVLQDSVGKQYNRLEPLVQGSVVIEPDQAVVDSVAFEETPLFAELLLELEVAGRERPIRFCIPGSLLKRSMGIVYERGPEQQPGAAASQPSQSLGTGAGLREPVKQSPFSAEVNAAYSDEVTRAKKRVLGMSSNDAVIFMRRRKAALVQSLAKKHGVTVDEIRKVLVEP